MTKFADEWRLLEGARPWMRERGYRLIDARGPEGMNQGFHVYAGRWVAIRLIADRDHWEVEARPDPIGADASGERDWFNVEAWSTCLGAPVLFRTSPTGEPMDKWALAPQLDSLRAHLAAIEAASDPERVGETRACLQAAQRDLAMFPRLGARSGA